MNQDIRNLDYKAQTPAEWRDWTWLTPEEFEHLRDYIYDNVLDLSIQGDAK